MLNFTIFTKLFTKLGHTVLPICDNRLVTIVHQIPIGCNTILWASRACSYDITAIKKVIKYFCLNAVVCSFFIELCLHFTVLQGYIITNLIIEVLLLTRGVPTWEFWFLPMLIIFCQNLPITNHQSDIDFTLICHTVLEH